MKASELNRKEQGPSHCAARCEELGMRMAALVLVSNELPGCVCQPKYTDKDKLPPPGETADVGASAATTGYVVIAAAAAAARQQQLAQQQRQQSYTK